MKFGQAEIPERIFDITRGRMRRDSMFTPEDIRQHLLAEAREDLAAINSIERNWSIIANRVMRACVEELRAAGEIEQVKKGVWAKA
ncbi:hypothetical protein WJ96_05425 [Burkholderia ubonensis]|uniref:Uncharacterized protein n=1 Tax=Burkholderia ubonensis TaxID=101571 RepID=A0AAW3MYE6_9BURK|nr:hypothetical protein [Burkholderia ubonensis]KVP75198.1 hypothetical protein WJ93_07215 [Burkholderia ubonensis]KVP98012.1 hypothetical protein WJ96_05425 [Burkholderia ubonensis]KVZ92709.1 hypothetical protein WL25_17085 [Burkholderia ubonensis]